MIETGTNRQLATQSAALNVGSLFAFQARYGGARIALDDGVRQYTYAQANERVNRLAHALATIGIQRGDRVGILAENRTEFVELELAAAKLAAIVAALNWRFVPAELDHCTQLVEPKVILVSARFKAQLDGISYRKARVIVIEDEYEKLLAGASAAEPPDVAEPEDGLTILYTSGTTGMPKGAMISHRAAIARGQVFGIDQHFAADDGFVAWAPLFHMASTDMTLATLMNGGKVTAVDGYKPERLAEIVTRERINWFVIMPGMVQTFSAAMRAQKGKVAGIKAMGAMADLIPREQLAEVTRLTGTPFLNSFGSTETGMPPASKGVVGIGETPARMPKVQSSGCRIRLVDEHDHDVPDGDPGELAIRGPTLFSGYWNAPETNAKDFRGGWFHMGDMFVRNPDGTLGFVDRRKYLIKSGGENIYPAEIERVLLADPRIGDAVVVRKPDDRWGEVPVAFVVRKDARLTEADVVACCNGKIARYKLPKEVRFVTDAELPRSATGKIKRYELEAVLKK
jgi:fatty-acyl-CoA synthase